MSEDLINADYDACSSAIQCHADKLGARLFKFSEGQYTIRVLAFDRTEALELAKPIINNIRRDLQLDLAEDCEVECWCGEKGKVTELYDVSGLDGTCGGLGELNCYCGGDLCICHHHGATECPGCADCEDAGEDWDE